MILRKELYKWLILAVILTTGTELFAQYEAQRVKAVYIEKIANFIEWPQNTEKEDNIFRIGVDGNFEMCELIQDAYNTRTIKGLKVEVVCLRKNDDLSEIDLVFLESTRQKELDYYLENKANYNYLLVTDCEGFGNKGSHVNFYITNEQTQHFELNKRSLDNDQFKADFLLLEFAKVIKK